VKGAKDLGAQNAAVAQRMGVHVQRGAAANKY